MKIKIILLMLSIQPTLYSQWIEIDTNFINDTIYEVNDFEIEFDSFLSATVYGGLQPLTKEGNFIPTYYRREDRSDLVYMERFNVRDSSLITGFWKLHTEITEENKIKKFWVKDMIWFYFSKDGVLIKQVFYNSGVAVKAQPFCIIYAD